MFDFLKNQLYLTVLMSLSSIFLFFQDEETTTEEIITRVEGPDMTMLWISLAVSLPIMIIVIAGMWKVFTKAGKPGWASLIPIYNAIVLLEIAGKPVWWIVLLLIPGVNLVILFIVSIDVAKNFGKGTGFGIGLALLGVVFYPILGFGDARYMPSRQQQYGGQYA
ncbi:MAG TPA: DUF5684 domain-containing protein [Pyrinomonadaceae bacterium]|nr:DUF5684 domain-containing protein [Pyrinomonadaceae bacterium]